MLARLRDSDAYRIYLMLEGALSAFLWISFSVNLVYQVETVHLNPLQLILVGTAMEGTAFLLQVPTGVFADVYSRRFSVIVGIACLGVSYILQGMVPAFGALLLGSAIASLGYAFLSGAEEAWIAGEVGEARVGAVFLRGTQVDQIGALVGIVIGTGLATLRLNLPVVTGGALMLVLAGVLTVVMPERNFTRPARGERLTRDVLRSVRSMRATLGDGVRLLRRSPLLLTIVALSVFFGMSSEGFDRLNVAHFLADYRFPPLGTLNPVVWFGIMNVGLLLLSLAGTELIRRRLDMSNHAAIVRTLLAINTLMIVSVIVFALAGNFALALAAFWCAAALRRMDNPIYTTWLTQSIEPRVRATVISIAGQVDAVGQIAGGPIIGAIGTFASLRAALVVAGAVLAPALPLFIRALGQGPVAPVPPATPAPEEASAVVEA